LDCLTYIYHIAIAGKPTCNNTFIWSIMIVAQVSGNEWKKMSKWRIYDHILWVDVDACAGDSNSDHYMQKMFNNGLERSIYIPTIQTREKTVEAFITN
jgi:hypothetical protein